ncbi:MAG: hypothetical protein QOE01_377 [Actinomycetota bacterium]|jgi:hypothetical protein|nr:hypothetical protein [Actinomycetota bacterium]
MPQAAVRPAPPEDRLRLLLDLIVASTEEPSVDGALGQPAASVSSRTTSAQAPVLNT